MAEIKRKCVGCGRLKNREEMIKLTRRNSDGEVVINTDPKIFGRSVYLCYNISCIEKSFHKKRIEKFLKTKINEEVKGKLIDFNKY